MKKNVVNEFYLLFAKSIPIDQRPASSLEPVQSQHLHLLSFLSKKKNLTLEGTQEFQIIPKWK